MFLGLPLPYGCRLMLAPPAVDPGVMLAQAVHRSSALYTDRPCHRPGFQDLESGRVAVCCAVATGSLLAW